jgi:hypothetical protein
MWAKRTIAVGLIAVVLAVLAVVWLWPRTLPKITEEQVNRIRPAMTLAEVGAVLGCPPGNHTCVHGYTGMAHLASAYGAHRKEAFKDWAADKPDDRFTVFGRDVQKGIAVRAWFDGDGRVINNSSVVYSYTSRSILDRIRRWLRRIVPTAF